MRYAIPFALGALLLVPALPALAMDAMSSDHAMSNDHMTSHHSMAKHHGMAKGHAMSKDHSMSAGTKDEGSK